MEPQANSSRWNALAFDEGDVAKPPFIRPAFFGLQVDPDGNAVPGIGAMPADYVRGRRLID
jgi:hypothetical protein